MDNCAESAAEKVGGYFFLLRDRRPTSTELDRPGPTDFETDRLRVGAEVPESIVSKPTERSGWRWECVGASLSVKPSNPKGETKPQPKNGPRQLHP